MRRERQPGRGEIGVEPQRALSPPSTIWFMTRSGRQAMTNPASETATDLKPPVALPATGGPKPDLSQENGSKGFGNSQARISKPLTAKPSLRPRLDRRL